MANQDVDAAPEEKEATEDTGKLRHQKNWLKRRLHWLGTHKKISIPLAFIILVAIIAAIPYTRYGLLGLVIKHPYQVLVVDSDTHKPVSEATVVLDGKKVTTDGAGVANIRANSGYAKLEVTKRYYRSLLRKIIVPITKPSAALKIELKAEGRPVSITILNTISKEAVNGAVLSVGGVKAKTNKDGKTTLVLPATQKTTKVQISGEGFNAAEATLTITADEDRTNTFELTPAGKLYFLSNQSGKLDLVKANLDGSERQVVLPGTGKEDKTNTVLLASRDWRYIALVSKRDGGQYAKLFLIEAGTDKVTIMDEGEAGFSVLGWSGDRFVYKVVRDKVQWWEAKREALKSYHAPSKKITLLAETAAEGDANNYGTQYLGEAYVLDKEVVYAMNWNGHNVRLAGKQATLNTIQADGSQRKTIKSFLTSAIQMTTAEFGEIYIQYHVDGTPNAQHEEYHDGKVASINLTEDEFYRNDYPFYAVSPSGKYTLWSEFRDGKNVFFVGDEKGENGKQIGLSKDFNVYGWYSDDYVLLTKNGSEMHIMPRGGLPSGVETSPKVSDYYKPNYTLRGYGYGYGG